jgi:hypothetical protein
MQNTFVRYMHWKYSACKMYYLLGLRYHYQLFGHFFLWSMIVDPIYIHLTILNCFVPAKGTHQVALYINAKYFRPIYALDIKTPIHQNVLLTGFEVPLSIIWTFFSLIYDCWPNLYSFDNIHTAYDMWLSFKRLYLTVLSLQKVPIRWLYI